MSASILNAPDWQFLTADFIDLGDADGETGAIPVLLGGANIAPVDSEVHLAIAAAPTTVASIAVKRSYSLKWSMVAALLPAACTGLHVVTQSAAVADETDGTRWFIGVGAGLTTLQPEAFCDCLTLSDDNDTSFNLYAGVDLTRRFAIEFQYADLGAPSVDFLGDPVGSIDYQVAGLSGLLYLFNTRRNSGTTRDGLSGYLKAGAGVLMNDSSLPFRQEHGSQLWLGAGLEYGVGRGWSVRTEYNAFDTDATQVTASLVKRFGGGSRNTNRVAVEQPLVRLQVPQPVAEVASVPEEPLQTEPSLTAIDLPTLFFDFDRHDLRPLEASKLERLASVLRSSPLSKLQIEGHTDARGSENYNNNLSIMRAEAVRDYLQQQDIGADRIEVLGYGEMQPVAVNSTEEGRAQNRRVELSLSSG